MVTDRTSKPHVREVVETGVQTAKAALSSPTGKKARVVLATGLIAAAPVIARHPYVRSTKMLRLIGIGGAAALIVKAAEHIRDWEPSEIAAE